MDSVYYFYLLASRLCAMRDYHLDVSNTSRLAGERRDADVVAAPQKLNLGRIRVDAITDLHFFGSLGFNLFRKY